MTVHASSNGNAPLAVVLASMSLQVEEITSDRLRGMTVYDRSASTVEEIRDSLPLGTRMVVIEADPREFVSACAALPDVNLLSLPRVGNDALMRFRMVHGGLAAIVRTVAAEGVE